MSATVSERDVAQLKSLLAQRKGLGHLRIRKRGDSLILYSGPRDDEVRHGRLTALGTKAWGLSLPHHTGRWARTPFVGPMNSVVDILIDTLGFYLEPFQ